MSLPIRNLCVEAIAVDNAVEDVLCCRTERAKDRETEGGKVKTMRATHGLVLIALPLLHHRQCRRSVPPPVTSGGYAYQVHAAMEVATPGIEEDISGLGEPRPSP